MTAVRARFGRWAAAVLAGLAAAGALAQAPDPAELRAIRERLVSANLPDARISQGDDGRITLAGSYRNRAEVLTAFSIAQQVVGVRWVAPTTPENIRYPFDNALSKMCQALGTCGGATKPAPAAPAAPPRPTSGAGGQRWGLVVGVGEFGNLSRDQWLQYTVRDAQLMHAYLIDPNGAAFPRANVTLLTNAQATRGAIEAAMDRIAAAAGPDDIVVLYMSSHGTPPNDRGTMQLITYDTVLSPRQQSFLTSLPDDKVADFAQRLGQTRLVVILDTCYSGAAFEKVPGFLATGAKNLRLEEERSTVVGLSGKSLRGMATGAKDLRFEDEQAPPPPNQGPRVLMSASGANEKAWESQRLEQSFFTHHLVQALRREPDIERAYLAAKPTVSAEVLREKRHAQTPQAVFMPRDLRLSLR
jgi:uncharacterized caspase-like protein